MDGVHRPEPQHQPDAGHRRRSEIIVELPDVVGLLRAFTNAQVPFEQALDLVSRQLAEADPGNILAAQLRLALGDYGLGETIEASLGRMADRLGVEEVRTLVTGIAQGKRLGAGTELIPARPGAAGPDGAAQPRHRLGVADIDLG